MLKVTLHAGPSDKASKFNRLDWLDIAYERLSPVADYKIVLFQDGFGAFEQVVLQEYPRWSGSLWDLVLRSILLSHNNHMLSLKPTGDGVIHLHRSLGEKFLEVEQGDKRFAYARHLSALITHYPGMQGSIVRQIGTCDIAMSKAKGHYTAAFNEHAGPSRVTELYCFKPLIIDASYHLANAISMALAGTQFTVPTRPRLNMPAAELIGKVSHIRFKDIQEPARTGFEAWVRLKGIEPISHKGFDDWFEEEVYWQFIGSAI